MLGLKYRAFLMKTICCYVLAIALSCSLTGCGKLKLPSGVEGFKIPEIKNVAFDTSGNGLSEVAPPKTIQQLKQSLNQYQPQVAIVNPRHNLTVNQTSLEVSLAVKDFPLFKDERFGIGSHLDLTLDNEPYGAIYNIEQPIVLQDLKPGTHTLRVLAQTPWHESYKNEGAFAQTTFHVLTETAENNPDPELPLLTYNQPDGVYSTEPILLDFYLTNVVDRNWLVKATINDESFTIDEWQPIYLKGFNEGNNLIKLELLDSGGQSISNAFNETIRLITYDPEGFKPDALAQLTTEQIAVEDIIASAPQGYYILPIEEVIEGQIIEEDITVEAPEEKVPEKPAVLTKDEPIIIEKPSLQTKEDITVETPEKPTVSKKDEPALIEEPSLQTQKDIVESTAAQTDEAISEQVEIVPQKSEKPNISPNINVEITPQKPTQDIPKIEIEIIPSPTQTPAIIPKTEVTVSPPENLPDSTAIVLEPEELPSIVIEEETIASETTETDKPKLKVPQWWKKIVAELQSLKQRVANAIEAFSAS